MKRIISILTVALIAVFACETALAGGSKIFERKQDGVTVKVYTGEIDIENNNSYPVYVDLYIDVTFASGQKGYFLCRYDINPGKTALNIEGGKRRSVDSFRLTVKKIDSPVPNKGGFRIIKDQSLGS